LDGTNLLTKLKKIEGKKYEFKSKAELGQILKKDINDSITTIPNFPEGEQYGLIAQEIEAEFPELVKLDSITMLRAINYDGMIPILLEALKTQQAQIENLQGQIEDCCNNSLKNGNIDSFGSSSKSGEAKLFQNQPNPFSSETTIRFEIPNRVNNAQLYICNMNGTLLKTFDINQRGSGNVTMNGNELNAGMYMYTLVADSKEVDTKKMILTD
jgi:Uri superfamily endonuclease